VAATLLITAAELWQSTAGWDLSYRFAPADRRAEYLSVFAVGVSAQEILAPLLLLGLVMPAGRVAWVGLALAFAALAAAAPFAVGALEGRRAETTADATTEETACMS
jgi:hypothetical protein